MSRTNNGQPSREVLDREARVLELRLAGMTFADIADQVGISDRSDAHKVYKRAMARVLTPAAREIRTVEGERLDRLQAAIWAKAMRGDVKATEQVLGIMRRRARLFGLDHSDKMSAALVRVEQTKAVLLAMALGKALDMIAEEVGLTDEQRDRATRKIFTELRVAEAAEHDEHDDPAPGLPEAEHDANPEDDGE